MNNTELDKIINNLIGVIPNYKFIDSFKPNGEFKNIFAITYDGVNYKDKKTKIFAYLGYPEDLKANEKRKAIVLVHGGGGHAFLTWVKKWNDLGYIAIAMNTAGDFPLVKNAWDTEKSTNDNEYQRELHSVFLEDGYTEIPTTPALTCAEEEISCQRYFHYVSSVILATNLLFSLPEVDKSKVGITGISWGGVITSTILGYDDRFAFAIPIYGSSYITESYCMEWKKNLSVPKARELWASERNIKNAKMPILWLCWNDDCAFSINSNSKSYLATCENNGKTVYSAVDNMLHSHIDGWKRDESYYFAESIVNDGVCLSKISGDYHDRNINLNIIADKRTDKNAFKATLYYRTEYPEYAVRKKYVYDNQYFTDTFWEKTVLTVKDYKIIGKVPDNAKTFFVELCTKYDGKELITTTPCEDYKAKE